MKRTILFLAALALAACTTSPTAPVVPPARLFTPSPAPFDTAMLRPFPRF